MSARTRVVLALAVLIAISLPDSAAAQSDTTPPQIMSLTISPTEVDASSSSVDVTVTAVITDDLSGVCSYGDPCGSTVAPSAAQLYSPTGSQYVEADLQLVSGDTYSDTATFPQYAEEGVWKDWSIYLSDKAGNYTFIHEDDLISAGINQAVGVDPFNASYSRTVSLKLTSTKAAGTVHSDVESSCFWFVPVILERKTQSGWKKVGSTLSLYNGFYRIRVHKPGRYRVTATEFGIGTPTVTTCSKASASSKLS